MTIHYHGTPITPNAVLYSLSGAHFCVSHAAPQQVRSCHEIGQSVMLDNGAFTAWKQGRPVLDWNAYYTWTDGWLDFPTTWAVIPDVVEGDASVQDALIEEWPHGDRGAPVWHMHEPINRMLNLCDKWPRVCIGSSAEYAVVLSDAWQARMDEVWGALVSRHKRTPWVHMLRGLQLVRERWPFASVDSTDIARNHSSHKQPIARMDRWDAMQCPATYEPRAIQLELVA